MTYKELNPQEVAEMLSKTQELGINCYVKLEEDDEWTFNYITGINLISIEPFISKRGQCYAYCAISIPDTYEPFPEDEMPNLKRLDGVMSKAGAELTVLTVFKEKKDNRHMYLSNTLWVTNKELFDNYTHLNGSPIGRKVGSEC